MYYTTGGAFQHTGICGSKMIGEMESFFFSISIISMYSICVLSLAKITFGKHYTVCLTVCMSACRVMLVCLSVGHSIRLPAFLCAV